MHFISIDPCSEVFVLEFLFYRLWSEVLKFVGPQPCHGDDQPGQFVACEQCLVEKCLAGVAPLGVVAVNGVGFFRFAPFLEQLGDDLGVFFRMLLVICIMKESGDRPMICVFAILFCIRFHDDFHRADMGQQGGGLHHSMKDFTGFFTSHHGNLLNGPCQPSRFQYPRWFWECFRSD